MKPPHGIFPREPDALDTLSGVSGAKQAQNVVGATAPYDTRDGIISIGFDPRCKVGWGWDRNSSANSNNLPLFLGQPLEKGFCLSTPQDAGVFEDMTKFDETCLLSTSGQALSLHVAAATLAAKGELDYVYQKSLKETSHEFQLDTFAIKSFAESRLEPGSLKLTPEAQKLMGKPADFKRTYGTHGIIGYTSAHWIRVHFEFSGITRDFSSVNGLHLGASGSWGTGNASFTGDFKEFLMEQTRRGHVRTSAQCTIARAAPLTAALTTTLANPGDVTNLFQKLAEAKVMVQASSHDSDGGAVPVCYLVAPWNLVLPNIPEYDDSEFGSRLDEYMAAYFVQSRALNHLEEIYAGKAGQYSWLYDPDRPSRWDQLTETAPKCVTENLESVLLPGLKKIMQGLTPTRLTPRQKAPFVDWPHPCIELMAGLISVTPVAGESQLWMEYDLKIKDCPNLPKYHILRGVTGAAREMHDQPDSFRCQYLRVNDRDWIHSVRIEAALWKHYADLIPSGQICKYTVELVSDSGAPIVQKPIFLQETGPFKPSPWPTA